MLECVKLTDLFNDDYDIKLFRSVNDLDAPNVIKHVTVQKCEKKH